MKNRKHQLLFALHGFGAFANQQSVFILYCPKQCNNMKVGLNYWPVRFSVFRKGLTLLRTLKLRVTFCLILSMWSSMSIPRHLTDLTFSNSVSNKERAISSSRLATLFLDPTTIKSVFNTFRVSLLAESQEAIPLRSFAILFCRAGKLQPENVTFISSANNLGDLKEMMSPGTSDECQG